MRRRIRKTAAVKHLAARARGEVLMGERIAVSMCGAARDRGNTIILAPRYANCPRCREMHRERTATK